MIFETQMAARPSQTTYPAESNRAGSEVVHHHRGPAGAGRGRACWWDGRDDGGLAEVTAGWDEAALRARVLADLRRLTAGDRREAAARRRLLDGIANLPHPFDRQAGPVHVTGSGIVTGPRGVLLHLHRRLGMWLQPGGHLEPGETPWEAAIRESVEETGLTLRFAGDREPALFHIDVHPAGAHLHLDLRYLLEADDQDPDPPLGESQEVRWFRLEEALAIADPGLAGALRRLRPAASGRRQP